MKIDRRPTHHGGRRLSPGDQADLDKLARINGVDGAARVLGLETIAVDPLVWGGSATQRRVETVTRALEKWRVARGA